MRIYLDTEFYENGQIIDLMSIGMVREDGLMFYAVISECDWNKPFRDKWHQENTLPNLWFRPHGRDGEYSFFGCSEGAYLLRKLLNFVDAPQSTTGEPAGPPEFWAWYSAYDWVALCQLFGRMNDLPKGWPMYCRDFKQVVDETGWVKSPEDGMHNAMVDALWLRDEHARFLHVKALADVRR